MRWSFTAHPSSQDGAGGSGAPSARLRFPWSLRSCHFDRGQCGPLAADPCPSVRSPRLEAVTGRRRTPDFEHLCPSVAAPEPQIDSYMGAVRQVARSLHSRLRADTIDLEELEADGFEALVRVIRDYDSSKGSLDRYIALRCRGAM